MYSQISEVMFFQNPFSSEVMHSNQKLSEVSYSGISFVYFAFIVINTVYIELASSTSCS